ncbi:MAG TPA: carbamoyl phosphate synthase small subunit [Clostridiales bacterium UBA8960]|jgi:carbamoyl-phosphate synthase small subunit|nr:carbamoyl phosphate synthase small subunit [Clostridiales bacterium UBA8960]
MKAKLILENGMVFEGVAFGHKETCVGEVVFNTGMTGYQEVLTDPSYYGQIVTMTYPLIGNYGINLDDSESASAKVRGFIVREKCEFSSNFRSEIELDKYLKQQKIMGITGIDTRALTRLIRNYGTMKGVITTELLSERCLKAYFDSFDNTNAVYEVTSKETHEIDKTKSAVTVDKPVKVSLMDFGAKRNIIRSLQSRGCHVTVYPASTKAETLLNDGSDLVFLSNGPGDPEDLTAIIAEVEKMIGQKPVAGICLGHQIIALAKGGQTAKLKFGHRGCNHPVKDLEKNKVYITSQNHGYHVSKLPKGFEVTHISMNDQSIEGMRNDALAVFSVQFHPEASPGPVESGYLFDEFLELVK